jgi:hypothetical protein
MSDVAASRLDAENERLAGYIGNSRRVQRRLRIALPIGLAIALAAWLVDGRVGFTLLVVTLAIVGIGYWITWGHITEWNTRIAAIRRERLSR